MEVYRIVLERFSDQLYAPGLSGRWNYDNEFVIYAASSRSLAAMENMVHKMGQGVLGTNFTIMVLDIPDSLSITKITTPDLPVGWKLESSYADTQPIGSSWYQTGETLLLQVPSAVVPNEYNFVLNARHPNFPQIKIEYNEPFEYDYRFVIMDKPLIKVKKDEG